jgi:hypothetical protein
VTTEHERRALVPTSFFGLESGGLPLARVPNLEKDGIPEMGLGDVFSVAECSFPLSDVS